MLAPALLSADLWRESGRYETYGEDLYKLKNREGSDFILGPTMKKPLPQLSRLSEIIQTIAIESLPNQPKYRDENAHGMDFFGPVSSS